MSNMPHRLVRHLLAVLARVLPRHPIFKKMLEVITRIYFVLELGYWRKPRLHISKPAWTLSSGKLVAKCMANLRHDLGFVTLLHNFGFGSMSIPRETITPGITAVAALNCFSAAKASRA